MARIHYNKHGKVVCGNKIETWATVVFGDDVIAINKVADNLTANGFSVELTRHDINGTVVHNIQGTRHSKTDRTHEQRMRDMGYGNCGDGCGFTY